MENKSYFQSLNAHELIEALSRLSSEESLAIPCLSEDERKILVSIVDALPYHPVQPIKGNIVHQYFDFATMCHQTIFCGQWLSVSNSLLQIV
jgi:hypothetical protein